MQKTKIRRTTLIVLFLISLICGLFISKFTMPLSISWLIICLIFLLLLARKSIIFIFAIIVIGLLIGWWRGGILQTQMQAYNKNFYEKVVVTGLATEDGVYGNKGQLEFSIENVVLNGKPAPGKIKISGYTPSINRHDYIEATGKLYPTLGGKQAAVYYADIDVLATANSPIEIFRKKFVVGMENALPEPAASFGIGLLVGQRSLLPDDVSLVLTIAGLTHIVAVSGYNLTIIIRAVTKIMSKFSRFQIFITAITLIYIFILVTGFSPSIVRAAFVAGIGLLAWYFGRTIRPILLIILVAAITGFINPLYVWGDIGWYLSFLAFFGVLILAPLCLKVFTKKDPKEIGLLPSIVVESFAAQIMTLPLIMFIFARFSIVGFLANIIVVPMVPFAMLFSLFAGLAGMIVPSVSGWIALPARLLLNLMLWIADLFANIPHANLVISISAIGMALMYGAIVAFISGLSRKAQSVTIVESSK